MNQALAGNNTRDKGQQEYQNPHVAKRYDHEEEKITHKKRKNLEDVETETQEKRAEEDETSGSEDDGGSDLLRNKQDLDSKREKEILNDSSGYVTLHISNLDPEVSSSILGKVFRPFGTLKMVIVSKDKTTGKCKGKAIVGFVDKRNALVAYKDLQNTELKGKQMIINLKLTKGKKCIMEVKNIGPDVTLEDLFDHFKQIKANILNMFISKKGSACIVFATKNGRTDALRRFQRTKLKGTELLLSNEPCKLALAKLKAANYGIENSNNPFHLQNKHQISEGRTTDNGKQKESTIHNTIPDVPRNFENIEDITKNSDKFNELSRPDQTRILRKLLFPVVKEFIEDEFSTQVIDMLVDLRKFTVKDILKGAHDKSLLTKRIDEAVFLLQCQAQTTQQAKLAQYGIDLEKFLKLKYEKQKETIAKILVPIVMEIAGAKFAPRIVGMLVNTSDFEVYQGLKLLEARSFLEEKVTKILKEL